MHEPGAARRSGVRVPAVSATAVCCHNVVDFTTHALHKAPALLSDV
jgi:hypothetical protein